MKKSVSDILAAQENVTGTINSGDSFLPVVDDDFLHGEFVEKKQHTFNSLSCQ